jgi:L-alanine-DL-glutamate epimerase-like enolase superfamily enzyme
MPELALLKPSRVQTFLLKRPVSRPVQTSFGIMYERPALFVRVEDDEGAHGWGEVWCNFPACGGEHRQRLIETILAPLLVSRSYTGAEEAFEFLDRRTDVLALQSGEPGPFAHAIAGVDLALWDLLARRAGLPLWRYLGGISDLAPLYASGLNPDGPEDMVRRARAEGYHAFKLKVGFGAERDRRNLEAVREAAGPDAEIMIDANQAWSAEQARQEIARLADVGPSWVEEPIRADRPMEEWRGLAAASPIALAAGENVRGARGFNDLIASGAFGVVQPDVAKWGGLSGCIPVAHAIRSAGLRFCPHYLGGGIGLLHSAHFLAAFGGPGDRLEVDANDNPLRTEFMGPLAQVMEGCARLGDEPGLGISLEAALLS